MADRHTNEETAVSAQRSQRLLDSLFTTQRMREIFSDHGRLQAMLDFEAALARGAAHAGLLPGPAAAPSGNTAIPLVKELTAKVALRDGEAARYVHRGATSQDTMDSGLVLQLRAGLTVIESDLARLGAALAALAKEHAATPLAGRT